MYSKCAQKNECSHKILNLCQIHEMHAPASLVVAILCLLVTFWKLQLEVKWRKQWWSRSINTNNKESKYSFMWDSHCGTSLNIKVNMKKQNKNILSYRVAKDEKVKRRETHRIKNHKQNRSSVKKLHVIWYCYTFNSFLTITHYRFSEEQVVHNVTNLCLKTLVNHRFVVSGKFFIFFYWDWKMS